MLVWLLLDAILGPLSNHVLRSVVHRVVFNVHTCISRTFLNVNASSAFILTDC